MIERYGTTRICEHRILCITDYGRPITPFFIETQNFLGLGRQIGQMNFGAFGTVSPLSMFFIIQPLVLPLKFIYFVAFSEYMNFTLHPHPKILIWEAND